MGETSSIVYFTTQESGETKPDQLIRDAPDGADYFDQPKGSVIRSNLDIGIARRIATDAHRNQVDKAGQPYIGHVNRVTATAVSRTPEGFRNAVGADRNAARRPRRQ